MLTAILITIACLLVIAILTVIYIEWKKLN